MAEHRYYKGPLGRPTKYKPEMVDIVRQYVDDTMSISVSAGGLCPTREGMMLKLAVYDNETISDWCERYPDFSVAVKHLDRSQGERLVQNGLVNRYNAKIATLILSHHGYVEKTATDITSKEEQIVIYRPEKLTDDNSQA